VLSLVVIRTMIKLVGVDWCQHAFLELNALADYFLIRIGGDHHAGWARWIDKAVRLYRVELKVGRSHMRLHLG